MASEYNRFEKINGKFPRFSSVGCYSLFYFANNDRQHELCADCANESAGSITDQCANWENQDMRCANCDEKIPASYGDGE